MYLRKMVKSAPQNNQTVIAIQQDCLKVRCCNLHFILIYFCICKSTYISKMLFCIQNFVIYIYEHNNINIYLSVCTPTLSTHSQDSLPPCISHSLQILQFSMLSTLLKASPSPPSSPICMSVLGFQ